MGITEHVHNVQQNGAGVHKHRNVLRNNVTPKKMQNNIIYHANACMRGRRSCSQEKTPLCLLFVCVKQCF